MAILSNVGKREDTGQFRLFGDLRGKAIDGVGWAYEFARICEKVFKFANCDQA